MYWLNIVLTLYATMVFRPVLSFRCSSSTVSLTASTLSKATLTTPNYPSNYNNNDVCTWRINAGSGNYVVLYITNFVLERNYDKLKVYDGSSLSSSSLMATYTGTLTGSSLPFAKSTGQYLSLKFTSDSSVQNRGIQAYYFSVENAATAVDCFTPSLSYTVPAQLVSTNFPNTYASNGQCTVVLDAGFGKVFSITVLYADIDYVSSTNCNNGGLSIHDGQVGASSTLLILCSVPSSGYTNTVYTSGQYAYIKYTYASSFQHRGFVISYTAYTASGATTLVQSVFTAAPSTTSSCSSRATFTASQTTNRITSPNYPSAYSNYLNCGYLITSSISGYSSVRIHIDDIYLENNYDILYIYDGSSSSYTNLASSVISSGSTYTSTGSSVYIVFTTDGSITRRGFSLSYTAVQEEAPACGSSYTQYQASTSTQSIQSPNFPSDYTSNTETYWLIVKPEIDDTLTYYFESFRLETDSGCDSYDYLWVYNGACTTHTVIAKYCGFRDNEKHTHTYGKYVLFKMKTDTSQNYRGFLMKYTVGDFSTESDTEIDSSVIAGAVVGSIIGLVIISFIIFKIKTNRANSRVSNAAAINTTTKKTLPSVVNKHDLIITPKQPKPKTHVNRIRSNYSVPQNLNVNIIPHPEPPPPYPPQSNAVYPPVLDPAYPPQGPDNQLYMTYGGHSSYPDPSIPNPFEYKPNYG